MDYIYIIEEMIQYIEENLEEPLTLEGLSQRCHLSKYYFHRIFTAVMGSSLKDYMNQRRLNRGLGYLLDTSETIADISYRLQFGSQVSFTRAFKNSYGLAPGQVRKKGLKRSPTPVPVVLKRVLKNFNSDVVTDFTFIEQEPQTLTGFYMDVELDDQEIQNKVNSRAEAFLETTNPKDDYQAFAVYFVNSPKEVHTCIHAFFGIDSKIKNENLSWQTYELPAMLYARFRYTGDLLHIGDSVLHDLKRWMKIAKIEMIKTEISFVQAYDKTYHEDGGFSLFLPIRTIPQGM